MSPLTQRPAWLSLRKHHNAVKGTHLRELFASDPTRGTRLTAEVCGVFLDYSKNRVTAETMTLLGRLAVESGLRERTAAMFRGGQGQRHRGAGGAARRPARAQVGVDCRRGGRCRRGGAWGARPHGRLRRPGALGVGCAAAAVNPGVSPGGGCATDCVAHAAIARKAVHRRTRSTPFGRTAAVEMSRRAV